MADIRIHKHFTDIVLDDPNSGRQRYWRDVMSQLEDQPFAVLKIGVRMPGMGAAYFCVQHGIVNICLAKDAATFENNTLKFGNDSDFAIFVHEAAHFQHIVVDGGVWLSPSLSGAKHMDEDEMKRVLVGDEWERLRSTKIRNVEYEAGWRAVFNDKIYTLFPDSRILLDAMIRNVLVYDLCRRGCSVADSIKKKVASGEEIWSCLDDTCVRLYEKYSELADINHIMKGVEVND